MPRRVVGWRYLLAVPRRAKPHRGTIAMSSLAFPTMSLQALASMALHHRQLRDVPDVVRPHVVATIYTSLLARLLPTVAPTDRLTVTALEPDTRVYGKRKYAAISRADVRRYLLARQPRVRQAQVRGHPPGRRTPSTSSRWRSSSSREESDKSDSKFMGGAGPLYDFFFK